MNNGAGRERENSPGRLLVCFISRKRYPERRRLISSPEGAVTAYLREEGGYQRYPEGARAASGFVIILSIPTLLQSAP